MNPLGVHAGVWALGVNWLLAAAVSRFTTPPEPERVQRIWGAVEDFVYGDPAPPGVTSRR